MTNLNHGPTPNTRRISAHPIALQAHNTLDTLHVLINRMIEAHHVAYAYAFAAAASFGDDHAVSRRVHGRHHADSGRQTGGVAVGRHKVEDQEACQQETREP